MHGCRWGTFHMFACPTTELPKKKKTFAPLAQRRPSVVQGAIPKRSPSGSPHGRRLRRAPTWAAGSVWRPSPSAPGPSFGRSRSIDAGAAVQPPSPPPLVGHEACQNSNLQKDFKWDPSMPQCTSDLAGQKAVPKLEPW